MIFLELESCGKGVNACVSVEMDKSKGLLLVLVRD